MATTCVSSGPQLASVDSTQSELLDAVLGGLLGVDLGLDAADSNALLSADVGTEDLLDQLADTLGLSSVEEVLGADLAVDQILDAVAALLEADGQTAALNVVNELVAATDPLLGTVQLGDLLQIETGDGTISNVDLNVLDLLTGVVQLYSIDNAVGATVPLTIDGAALGLDEVLVSATLQAYITEPPVIVCGSDGTTFHSAAMRLKLDLDLVDVALDTTDLEDELLAPIADLLGVLELLNLDVNVTAALADLNVYAEVARGDGTISFVDAIANSVTVQAVPGAVDLYLGTMDDAIFFNRNSEVMTTSVDFGTIASVDISADVLGITSLNLTTTVEAKAFAQGDDGTPETLTFTGPYPQTLSTASSATFTTNLLDNLLANLELQLGSSLDDTVGVNLGLDEIVLSAVEGLLGVDAEGLLGGVLDSVLTGLVDPLLETLGTDLGTMHVTVLGIQQLCPDLSLNKSHSGLFERGGSGDYRLDVTNVGTLNTSGSITLVDTLPDGLTFLTYASGMWSLVGVDGQTVTFAHQGPIAVGDTATLLLAVEVDYSIADTVINGAAVTTVGDQNAANDTDTDSTNIEPIDPNGDADDDCVPNSVEDLNGNGDYFDDDTDNDTIPNFLDSDDDGDSLHTCTVEDEDGNGDPTNDDTDDDGTPNYLDPDDDDDTVPTVNEDPNGNNDPTDDDTDDDGTPNYLDPDDDDDTVPTVNEDPNGNGDPTDDDTDNDGTPNYLDPDDDDDTVPTVNEDPNGNGDPTDDDTDDDGTPNYLDPDDDDDTVPTVDEDPNGNGDPTDDDTDDDGTPNYLDPDDDGDDTPTKNEDPNRNGDPQDDDSDNDGTPDYLDPDDKDDPDFQDGDDKGNVFLPLITRSCVSVPASPCL